MFGWRFGTLSSSMRMPQPPLALISEVLHIMPAAPISCMPTMASVCASSSVASSKSFSAKGSPTWMEGISLAESSVMFAEANVLP